MVVIFNLNIENSCIFSTPGTTHNYLCVIFAIISFFHSFDNYSHTLIFVSAIDFSNLTLSILVLYSLLFTLYSLLIYLFTSLFFYPRWDFYSAQLFVISSVFFILSFKSFNLFITFFTGTLTITVLVVLLRLVFHLFQIR